MQRIFTTTIIMMICIMPITCVSVSINEKVMSIIPGKATREQVIEVFGKPDKYVWGEETFSEEGLPERYVMFYEDVGVNFAVDKYTVWEVYNVINCSPTF